MINDKIEKRKIIILKDTEEIDIYEGGFPIYDLELDLTQVFKIENNLLKIDDDFRDKYNLEIDDWYMALIISCNDSIEWTEEYKVGSKSIFIGQDWNGNYYSVKLTTAPYRDEEYIGPWHSESFMADDYMTSFLKGYDGIYEGKKEEIFNRLTLLRETIKSGILIQVKKLTPQKIEYFED